MKNVNRFIMDDSFEENWLSKIRVNKNKYLHVVIWIHVIPQMVIYLFDSFQM